MRTSDLEFSRRGHYADTIWGWFLAWECGTFDTYARRFYEGCCATLRAIDPAKPILMSPCPVDNLGFPPFPAVYADGTTWASNLARSDIDRARQHAIQIVFNEFLASMASPRNTLTHEREGIR